MRLFTPRVARWLCARSISCRLLFSLTAFMRTSDWASARLWGESVWGMQQIVQEVDAPRPRWFRLSSAAGTLRLFWMEKKTMRTLQIALTATAALCIAACSGTGPSGPAKLLTLDGNPPLVIAHRGASGYLPE